MKKHPALSKNDTRQLLIESTQFISKVNLSKELKESVELSRGKSGTLIVKNVPCTILNRVNQNGRIYSTRVVKEAIDEAKELHLFETKQLFSQADEHPEGSFVAPTHSSHVVIDAYIKPNIKIVVEGQQEQQDVLFMDLEVLNTQEGKNLRALFEAECSIGTSIRGVGDMNGKNVENYSILGVDMVGNPSSSTFTRMPVSESVKVELKDPRKLEETFTVTTSSTNVVRDLEAAANVQEQLDSIGYGTVTKTSTKVDEETDPKTGAQTSITTLEAETSDDVGDLDQALMMAKNAMLNGVVNIDSITIENVKEEQPKEATEEEYAPLKEDEDMKQPVTEATEDKENKNKTEGKKFVLKTPNGFVAMDGNTLVFKDDPKQALHFISGKEESGLVHLSGVEKILDAMGMYDIEKYYRKDTTDISAKEEPSAEEEKKEGIVGGALGAIAGGALGTALGGPAGALGGAAAGYGLGSDIGDDLSDSAKEPAKSLEEDNGSNTKYVATVSTEGPGNAPEISTVPVSATEYSAILSEISNLWEMKSKATRGHVDIDITDTSTGQRLHYDPTKNDFDDLGVTPSAKQEPQKEGIAGAILGGAAGNLIGHPIIGGAVGSLAQDALIDSAEEPKKEGIAGAILGGAAGSLVGHPIIGGAAGSLAQDALVDSTENLQEVGGEVQQKDNSLSIDLGKNTTAVKNFDSVAQASVVKSALEQGKLPGDVMLDEEKGYELQLDLEYNRYAPNGQQNTLYFDGSDDTLHALAVDLNKLQSKLNTKHGFADMGNGQVYFTISDLSEAKCNNIIRTLLNMGYKITPADFPELHGKTEATKEDENEDNKKLKSGWYVSAPNVGFSGPFDSEEEAKSGLEGYEDLVRVDYVEPDIEEKVYSAPSDPSDEYVDTPLNDSINEAGEKVNVTVSDLDYDIESIMSEFGTSDVNEDLQSFVNKLPETLSIEMDVENLDQLDDPTEAKELIRDALNMKFPYKINDFNIVSMY